MKWGGKNVNRFMNKISKTIPQDFGKVSISYSTTKLRSLLPKFTTTPKPFLPEPGEHKCEKHLLRSDLVYIYECDCGAVYIGQTLRRLDVRIKEHQTKKTSAIYQHSLTCPHSLFSYVDRDKFKIVAGNLKHYNARLRYETIYIRYYNTNARSAMNECIASKEMAIFWIVTTQFTFLLLSLFKQLFFCVRRFSIRLLPPRRLSPGSREYTWITTSRLRKNNGSFESTSNNSGLLP